MTYAIENCDSLTLAALTELTKVYPDSDAALAELIELKSELARPKPAVHVISDIHGEFKKLKHVINNASGGLRPLVQRIFELRLSDEQRHILLSFLYYPRESYAYHAAPKQGEERARFLREILEEQLEIIRELAKSAGTTRLEAALPDPYQETFRELLCADSERAREDLVRLLVCEFGAKGREAELFRMTARLTRHLLIAELVVAGDLGDRGPRIDKVIDILMYQPNVAITWGNHDASWLGACLGDRACIATVLRVSLRYRRLSQLEEGYGITIAPLEKLARTVYGDDPAVRFECKGHGMRDSLLMARMQKAAAIIQFKLEGETIRRNPRFNLEHRNLLHRINPAEWSVSIDGKTYPMLDTSFPTIAWDDPYRLSADEEACIERMRESFMQSRKLWDQMNFVVSRGNMFLRRDQTLIFHACVPVDEKGGFQSFEIDGVQRSGRALFDALEPVVRRSLTEQRQTDLDLLWYLWGGPLSPWFGKDKMATFETYFVAEKSTHKEHKNPYFQLIHQQDFCRKILAEFDINSDEGLIVNGHVPVKIEEGENPLKKSGMAVTIDGAFSEAYGDKGYTLILEPGRIQLAQHHHFESVSEAITVGADIVPEITGIRSYTAPRLVENTERGEQIRGKVRLLELLMDGFRKNVLRARQSVD